MGDATSTAKRRGKVGVGTLQEQLSPEDDLNRVLQRVLQAKGLPWIVVNMLGAACGLVEAAGYSPLEAAEMGMDIARAIVKENGAEGKRGIWAGLDPKDVN